MDGPDSLSPFLAEPEWKTHLNLKLLPTFHLATGKTTYTGYRKEGREAGFAAGRMKALLS